MNNIRWVIQNNLIAENELKEIQNTCKSIGVEYEEVLVVLFKRTSIYHRRKREYLLWLNHIYE
jgi:hypothetical protein